MSKNKFYNILYIDKKLSEGKVLTITNIQKELNSTKKTGVIGTSKRNIEYYIQQMREGEFGKKAPIVFDEKENGYYYEIKGFSLFYSDFSDQEKFVLQKTLNVLKGLDNNDLVGELSSLINRSGYVREQSIIEYEKPFNSIPTIFDDLYHYILEKKVLRIEYTTFKKQEEIFNITPYLLKEFRNRWYLVGYDNGNDRIVNLGLERIQDIEVNKNISYKSCPIDLKSYYSNTVGLTISNKNIEEVVIKVIDNISPYIKTKPIHSSQKLIDVKDDTSIFSYHLIINIEFRAEILRYGSAIEVVSPQWFRDEIKNELIKSLAKYSS